MEFKVLHWNLLGNIHWKQSYSVLAYNFLYFIIQNNRYMQSILKSSVIKGCKIILGTYQKSLDLIQGGIMLIKIDLCKAFLHVPCTLIAGTIGVFERAFSLLSSLQTVHISQSLLELLNGRRGNCHPEKGNPSLSLHWDNQGISKHVLRRRCSPDPRKSRNIAWNRLSFKTVQLLTSFDPLFLLLLHPELKM